MNSDQNYQESWSEIVDSCLTSTDVTSEVADYFKHLAEVGPENVTIALNPAVARRHKRALTGFVLAAIQHAVADHALTDDEVRAVRHICRLLRVDEGDLLNHQRDEVGAVLAYELERLLEDDRIDNAEAVHKVKLQEILGLSYDQFVALTAPQVEAVLVRLLRRYNASLGPSDIARYIHWFRDCVVHLDTVYDLNSPSSHSQRSGYVYLLVNPAMPDLVKIGKTTRKPSARVAELSGATGVPVPFELVFDVAVVDAQAAERYVHDRLEVLGARAAGNREFFRTSPSEAVKIMLQARDAIGGFGVVVEPLPDLDGA